MHIFHSTLHYRLHYNSINIMADRKAALALVIATIVTLALLHIKLTPKESFQK